MINVPTYVANRIVGVTLQNAQGTNLIPFVGLAAGSVITEVDSIIVSSDDTVERIVEFYYTDNLTNFFMISTRVPPGAGYNTAPGTPAKSILEAAAFRFSFSSGSLKTKATTPVTAGKTITVVAHTKEYQGLTTA